MIEAQNTRKEALFVPQNIQRCFQRYEKKYLLNLEQYQKIRAGLAPYMEADEHGRYTICNLYYDTPDFQLIRASLDKPVYKEKLRMRSYGVPADGDSVFVELKKKYKGVVYKRRTALEAGRRWLPGGTLQSPCERSNLPGDRLVSGPLPSRPAGVHRL